MEQNRAEDDRGKERNGTRKVVEREGGEEGGVWKKGMDEEFNGKTKEMIRAYV